MVGQYHRLSEWEVDESGTGLCRLAHVVLDTIVL